MAGSTYSTNLKIELMSTGENSGTWGDITNTNLGTALEQAIVGYGNPDYASDANLTISITNSNAAQAARALVLNVTSTFGSLTATRELVVPTIQKQYIVQNNTAGGQSITVKTSAGTGITVPNGRKAHLYVDGTNVIQMFDFVDINGGTIDGTAIGGSSASTGAFTTLNASGATTLDGNVTLGNASGDTVTVTGTIASNLLFTDNTYDIGASGATRPRNLYLAGAATIGGNLSVGGTLTLTGGLILNGNVTVGDSSADTLTVNATITSNLLFTDNTYDIGASGATRPRNLFLAGNATIGGNQTLTGSLTVDSTTDSSSTTTGSIQTDGGVGIAKALYVGANGTIIGRLYNGDASTFGASTWGMSLGNGGVSANYFKASTTYWQDNTGTQIAQLSSGNLEVASATAGVGFSAKGSATGTNVDATTSRGGVLNLYNTSATDGNTSAIGFYNSNNLTSSYISGVNVSHSGRTGALVFGVANGSAPTEGMRLTSTGLGLGITSPGAKLDISVAGTASYSPSAAPTPNVKIQTDGSGNSRYTSLSIGSRGSSGQGQANYITSVPTSDSDSALAFSTYGSYAAAERMRITGAGSVAIGDNSASSKLFVRSDSSDTAFTDQYNVASGSGITIQNESSTTGTWAALTAVSRNSSSVLQYASMMSVSAGSGYSPNMVFVMSDSATTSVERARIYSDGNMALGYSGTSINGFTVGNYSYTTAYAADIGSAAADFGYGSSLNVWAQSDSATISGITLMARSTGRSRWDILNVWQNSYLGDLVLRYRSGGTSTAEAMRITSSGIVGIGTNSPGSYSTKFSINGNSTARMMNIDNAGANGVNVGFSNNGTDVGFLGSAKWVTNGTLTDFAIGSINSLIFSQNGNERARIDGSGRLLVGTTTTSITSSEKFEVNGVGAFLVSSTTVPAVYLQNSDATAATNQPHLYLSDGSANRGALGLVNSTSQLWINGQAGIAFRYGGSGTGTTEAARITSSGGLWVGTTTRQSTSNHAFIQNTVNDWTANFQCNTGTSSQNLGILIYYAGSSPNNTSAQFLLCQDPGGTRAEIRSNGGIANYSANNVNLSDVRTKTDIQDAGGYLAKICAIPVRTFKYKDQTDDLLNLGVIAQEVEAVAPELVDVSGFGETPEDGVPLKAIYQTDLQYALMKAIQELKAEFDAYKASHP